MKLLKELNEQSKVWERATHDDVLKYIDQHPDAEFDIARMRSSGGVMTLIDVDDAFRVKSDYFWSGHVKKMLAQKDDEESRQYTRKRLVKLLKDDKISEFDIHRIK